MEIEWIEGQFKSKKVHYKGHGFIIYQATQSRFYGRVGNERDVVVYVTPMFPTAQMTLDNAREYVDDKVEN